jgi:hypothetical protein
MQHPSHTRPLRELPTILLSGPLGEISRKKLQRAGREIRLNGECWLNRLIGVLLSAGFKMQCVGNTDMRVNGAAEPAVSVACFLVRKTHPTRKAKGSKETKKLESLLSHRRSVCIATGCYVSEWR